MMMPSPWERTNDDGSNESDNSPTAEEPTTEEKEHGTKIAPEEEQETDEFDRHETFTARSPDHSLDDLIVPEETRKQIDILLDKLEYQELLYDTWNLEEIDPRGERTVLNLYGPPGTGKTFCAEGIAKYLDKPIIDINYAQLESKYVGETPKNVVAAFRAAKEHDAVLFFDEADSILSKRLVDIRQSADYGVNQTRSVMLKQLEEYEGVVVFATNMAENYDGAFIRRILGHVRFELPNDECRRKLWDSFLLPDLPTTKSVSANKLAAQSEGLSGGDIKNVVLSAAGAAVSRDGARGVISEQDLETQIERIRQAKKDHGNFDYGSNQATTQQVDLQDAPVDVREEVEESDSTNLDVVDAPHWSSMPRKLLPIGLHVLQQLSEADGVVDKREREALRSVLSFCSPSEAEKIWEEAKEDTSSQDVAQLAETPWARLVVRDAVMIGFSDGRFSENERTLVQKVASEIGIDDEFIKECEAWASEGLRWRRKGSSILLR